MKPGKIYDNDPEVYARTTNIDWKRTKAEIDGVLTQYGIKDVMWHTDKDGKDISVKFILSEKFREEEREIPIFLKPPIIWKKKKSGDIINWNASMRNLYWYIKTHLSQAYVSQSSIMTEFLPHILLNDGSKFIDKVEKMPLALPETIQVN